MTETVKKKINILPAPTFRWLNVNYVTEEVAEGAAKSENEIVFKKGVKNHLEETVAGTDGVYNIKLNAEAGSRGVYIQRIDAEKAAGNSLNVKTSLTISDDSEVTLVQLIKVPEGEKLINDYSADLAGNAGLKLIQLYTGSGKIYSNVRTELTGSRSRFENDAAYVTCGSGVLDINLTVNHHGKKTKSEINVNGVLKDSAAKTFKGTINFKKGAAGAEGAEREDVLLIDDTVVNKTVPLILCDEEDVSGSHGATIGRLDENLMFYLSARGLEEEEIYDMMAQARVDALLAKVPENPGTLDK